MPNDWLRLPATRVKNVKAKHWYMLITLHTIAIGFTYHFAMLQVVIQVEQLIPTAQVCVASPF